MIVRDNAVVSANALFVGKNGTTQGAVLQTGGQVIDRAGGPESRIGGTNAWPVDMLQPRDVYVSDHFGLKDNGASVGDNVGSAISMVFKRNKRS